MKKSSSSSSSSSKNMRRFSDEQIRSLEVMFESDTKLEPKKKVVIARELGLHPRQVAIWFQNKRARWKSKHIEKEYNILLAKYNDLASYFDSLKKENQSLLIQMQKLKNEMMEKSDHQKGNQETGAGTSTSTDGESDCAKIDLEARNIASRCLEEMVSDDDDRAGLMLGLGLEEENDQLLKMVEPAADSSLTTAEDWGTHLDSDHDLVNDQPITDESFQWWDFWS